MGIYDRDYYREGPSFLASISERGHVCKWLIMVNVACFITQLVTQQAPHVEYEDYDNGRMVASFEPITDLFSLNTQKVLHGEVWRLVTCAFLHGSLYHIFFNMLFLFWFGSDVEDLYGKKEFFCFYMAGVLVSSLAYVGWQVASGDRASAIGASGAVTAVMVLFAMHYPSRMILLFCFIPVPIWFFVLFQVLQDSYIFLGGLRTGVAVTAHLGGAAFGFAYYKFQWRVVNILPGMRFRSVLRSRPKLRVFREEEPDEPTPEPVAAPAGARIDEHFEAKVDAVLEKMSRHGKESLTEGERDILLRASEAYKKRRS